MKGFKYTMKCNDRRKDIVIHGIFVLAVMALCLISTVTFALAADGEATAEAAIDPTHAPTQEEILAYLDANPDIPPEVREQILQSASNPEELASIVAGLHEYGEAIENPSVGILPVPVFDGSETPSVSPAGYTLPPDFVPPQEGTPEYADFQLYKEALASSDFETVQALHEKYEGESDHNEGAVWLADGVEQEFRDNPDGDWPEAWKETYQEWSGDHEILQPSESEYDNSHEYSSAPEQYEPQQYEPEAYQNEFEGNQEMEHEQYQQEQEQQEYQPLEGQDYQPPQP
ncbi:MAG: hypothetical protein HY587_03975 [Candidatus Omnitrophica bacterium]|nr:hypothetical protein [Candidatus Omnitrophota bacterium]